MYIPVKPDSGRTVLKHATHANRTLCRVVGVRKRFPEDAQFLDAA